MTRSRSALEGLPHSEILGSKPVCGSPRLIAAYRVLHRRPAPRHPPYALSSLTTTSTLLKRLGRSTFASMPFTNSSVLLRFSMSRGFVVPHGSARPPIRCRRLGHLIASLAVATCAQLVELTGIEPVASSLRTRRSAISTTLDLIV